MNKAEDIGNFIENVNMRDYWNGKEHWIDLEKREQLYAKKPTSKDIRGSSKAEDHKKDFEKAETGAIKQTAGKVRLDLMPFEALMEIGKVYTFGVEKYDDHNWRKGLKYMKHHIGAALRHVFKFSMGHDRDEETGLFHTAHACFHLMAITTYLATNRSDLDDRVKL